MTQAEVRGLQKGALTMYTVSDIMRSLGRIEGELVEIRKLSERVSRLEQWQAWLKGGWGALAAAFCYLLRAGYER